jgi:hypothetical protein
MLSAAPAPAQPAALGGFPASLGKAVGQQTLRHLVELLRERPQSIVTRAAAIQDAADQIAPAQRDQVEREPVRGAVDEPLDQVVGFGLPGPVIGVDRHGVP